MFKKSLVIFLSVLFICFLCIPTFALASQQLEKELETDFVRPFWTYITSYQNTFDISTSGKATVEVILYSFSVDKIKVEANLQQHKNGTWITIKSWMNTCDGISCDIGESWYVMSGYSYRLVSTGAVYKNGRVVEQTTYTSDEYRY